MAFLAGSTVLFIILATVVLRWARRDLRENEWLSSRSLLLGWALYLMHADTVAIAAWADPFRVQSRPLLVLGITIGVAGALLFFAATVRLARRGAMEGPLTTELVTGGAYGLLRHPQSIGWGLMLAGLAIGGGSPIALILVGLYALFMTRYLRLEERHLFSQFGRAYFDYASHTRLLPLRRSAQVS